MDHRAFAEQVGLGLEVAGIVVVVAGAVLSTLVVLRRRASYADIGAAIEDYRNLLGRTILLGLEFLVAADIVSTVSTTPSIDSVLVLAAIVAIRTFLSLSLGVEIEGRFPWQRSRRPERPATD